MDVRCEVWNRGVFRDGCSGVYGRTAGMDILLYSFFSLALCIQRLRCALVMQSFSTQSHLAWGHSFKSLENLW